MCVFMSLIMCHYPLFVAKSVPLISFLSIPLRSRVEQEHILPKNVCSHGKIIFLLNEQQRKKLTSEL